MNFSLPSWLILILLISILVHSAYKTFKKAMGELYTPNVAVAKKGLKMVIHARNQEEVS
jgi:hypothetical protein